MRRGLWLAAALLALAIVTPAQAQRRVNPFFFGVDPTEIINQPIDTSHSVVPIAEPQTRSTLLRLLDIFPRFRFPDSKPLVGQSVFPTQSQLPGKDYLRAFGVRRARPVGE